MIKFRLYFDKDAETNWLNQMSAKGWALRNYFAGFYFFDPSEKDEYIYQIDFVETFFHISENYREFMQDIGVEIISNFGFWVFLRRPSTAGAFELYTDVDSRINHYTKIRTMFKAFTILEIICLFMELFAAINGSYLGNVFALIIAALVLAFLNITWKTNNIILKLQEKKGELTAPKSRKRIPIFLPIGLLLDSSGLLLNQTQTAPFISHALLTAAVIFILIGIIMVLISFSDENRLY